MSESVLSSSPRDATASTAQAPIDETLQQDGWWGHCKGCNGSCGEPIQNPLTTSLKQLKPDEPTFNPRQTSLSVPNREQDILQERHTRPVCSSGKERSGPSSESAPPVPPRARAHTLERALSDARRRRAGNNTKSALLQQPLTIFEQRGGQTDLCRSFYRPSTLVDVSFRDEPAINVVSTEMVSDLNERPSHFKTRRSHSVTEELISGLSNQSKGAIKIHGSPLSGLTGGEGPNDADRRRPNSHENVPFANIAEGISSRESKALANSTHDAPGDAYYAIESPWPSRTPRHVVVPNPSANDSSIVDSTAYSAPADLLRQRLRLHMQATRARSLESSVSPRRSTQTEEFTNNQLHTPRYSSQSEVVDAVRNDSSMMEAVSGMEGKSQRRATVDVMAEAENLQTVVEEQQRLVSPSEVDADNGRAEKSLLKKFGRRMLGFKFFGKQGKK